MKNISNLVILGTARKDSNTLKALQSNFPLKDLEIVDLNDFNINPYSYDQPAKDDFILIAEKMTQAHVIVFATPVYWYAMSGSLKTFFDRLTELTTSSKELGRLLAGKKVYLFATGSDSNLPEGFEEPFIKTSDYFNMKYKQAFYVCTKNWS